MTVGRAGRRGFDRGDESEAPYRPWSTGGYGEPDAPVWEPEPSGRRRPAGGRHSADDDERAGWGEPSRRWSEAGWATAGDAWEDGGYTARHSGEARWERETEGGYPPTGYRAGGYRTGSYPTAEPSSFGWPRHEPERDWTGSEPGRGVGTGGPAPGWSPSGDATWGGAGRGETTGQWRAVGDTGAWRTTGPRRADRVDAPDDELEPVGAAADAGDDEDEWSAKQRERRKGLPLWQELPLLLIIAFCLAVLIRTFLMQAFFIPSGSMEDTLLAGDRVLVNKVVYHFREPRRGEIVVFRGTDAWAPAEGAQTDVGAFTRLGRALGDLVGISHPGEKDYIKRIIGLPGDRVSCCDEHGRVLVNGQPLDEPYVVRDSPLEPPPAYDCRGRRFDEVVVAPGHIFVMGDHRLVSQDSRCQGQVPIENVIGRAFVIVWPNDRWATLSAPETFDDVPSPQAAAAPPVLVPATAVPDPIVLLVLPLPTTFAAVTARSLLSASGRPRRLAA